MIMALHVGQAETDRHDVDEGGVWQLLTLATKIFAGVEAQFVDARRNQKLDW